MALGQAASSCAWLKWDPHWIEVDAGLGRGEAIIRSDAQNAIVESIGLGLQYGFPRDGLTLGLSSYRGLWRPKNFDDDKESFGQSNDSIRTTAWVLTTGWSWGRLKALGKLGHGHLSLPSRIAETTADGLPDSGNNRGRYRLMSLGTEARFDLIRGIGLTLGVGLSLDYIWLNGGGACGGFDPDCGDDFGERNFEQAIFYSPMIHGSISTEALTLLWKSLF